MPKAGDAGAPLLAQPVQAFAVAQSAAQAPPNVLRAAAEMQTGTGVMSMDLNTSLNVNPPMMAMPPGGMSLQQQTGVHAAAMPVSAGLGYLASVQGLCIRQNIRLAELLVGFEQQ